MTVQFERAAFQGEPVRQFSATIADDANRGMWYVALLFRTSSKRKWALKSPLRPLDGDSLYETKAQADRDVVHHRMGLEGHFQKRGGSWCDTRSRQVLRRNAHTKSEARTGATLEGRLLA
jgi:hypothetical protein